MTAPASTPSPLLSAARAAVATPGRTTRGRTIKVIVTSALSRLAALWIHLRNRRQVNDLLVLDEYLLRDIGVARGDVFEALSNPFVNDPSSLLAAAANRHRAVERARVGEHLRSARLMSDADRRPAPAPPLAA